ncbi:flagellar hook capping FlgD N-terminal domain-containing protein [Sphingobium sp.]|uniref:flagellar hook capping FlgD N-terminal domain-containing protein n=1 Tax=Sphingobium sp. TaxID=1912891 RepID=UPI002CCAA204|nr:flagellar hook capping FlgD N-terminal domain-containing protein [Sphingobium sp.]HUD93478.1 flagellar hook capping FlgD N-terminal domain-containing protein [Sphingobium sp.]
MINQVGANAFSSVLGSGTATTKQTGLDVSSADFLTLLTAQFKYQDPFALSDPTQNVQQLATLAQLTTLKEIEASLQQLIEAQKQRASSQAPSAEHLSTLQDILVSLKAILAEQDKGMSQA